MLERKQKKRKIDVQEIFQKARENDRQAIEAYLENGGDINVQDQKGYNILALVMSADGFDDDLAIFLIEKRILIDNRTFDFDPHGDWCNVNKLGFREGPWFKGATLLHLAYFHFGNEISKTLKALIQHPAIDINARCSQAPENETLYYHVRLSPGGTRRSYEDGYHLENATLLHFAAADGNAEVLVELLKAGKAKKAINANITCALIQNNHLYKDNGEDMVSDYHTSPILNEDGSELLAKAFCCREFVDIVRIKDVTPLHLVARSGKKKLAPILIQYGATNTKDSLGLTAIDHIRTVKRERKKFARSENSYVSSLRGPEIDDLSNLFVVKLTVSGKPPKRYKKRLFLGEADFSYTVALLKKHGQDEELSKAIVATELEQKENLEKTYPETFSKNLAYLKNKNVQIVYGADARLLHWNGKLKSNRYKRIQFNFPHDRSAFQERKLEKLVTKFFASATRFQRKGDRIHLAGPGGGKSKLYQAYYGLYHASAKSGYRLIKVRKFDAERYPGYKHQMTGANKSVIEKGREYIFEKTDLKYEQIKAAYPPKSEYIHIAKKNYDCLPDMKSDNDSSDYEENEESDSESDSDLSDGEGNEQLDAKQSDASDKRIGDDKGGKNKEKNIPEGQLSIFDSYSSHMFFGQSNKRDDKVFLPPTASSMVPPTSAPSASPLLASRSIVSGTAVTLTNPC